MKTRLVASVAVLGAALSFGLTACGTSSHAATREDVQKWVDATQTDPAWQAIQNEVNGDTTDPDQCRLLLHDQGEFLKDHPKAPVGESEWNASLASEHDEYAELCRKQPDLAKAMRSAGDAADHLKNFQKVVHDRFPDIKV